MHEFFTGQRARSRPISQVMALIVVAACACAAAADPSGDWRLASRPAKAVSLPATAAPEDVPTPQPRATTDTAPKPPPLRTAQNELVPLSLHDAIDWALERNPDLAVKRRDLGIARAQIVIADYYPFNPVFQATLQGASAPGLKDNFRQAYSLSQEIELAGQSDIRRAQANAGWARATWEVRQQEVALSVLVARRYQTLVNLQRRLQISRETYSINNRLAEQTEKLFQANQVSRADVLLTRLEAIDSRRLDAAGESAYLQGQLDLRAALGVTAAVDFVPLEQLQRTAEGWNLDSLLAQACDCNPEIRVKQAALNEANSALNLALANQHANLTAGPAAEVDENHTVFIGGQLSAPLQIFNRKQGEVRQAEAQRNKAAEDLAQTQARIKIQLLAALESLNERLGVIREMDRESPQLAQSLDDAGKLFSAGLMDLLKLVEVRRRGIAARQQLLDAQHEATLAELDLTAATGCPRFKTIPLPERHEATPPQR